MKAEAKIMPFLPAEEERNLTCVYKKEPAMVIDHKEEECGAGAIVWPVSVCICPVPLSFTCVRARACVCVCVREREREKRERERECVCVCRER